MELVDRNSFYSGLVVGMIQKLSFWMTKFIKLSPQQTFLAKLSTITTQLRFDKYETNTVTHNFIPYSIHIALRFCVYESMKSLLNQTYRPKQINSRIKVDSSISLQLFTSILAGGTSSLSTLLYNAFSQVYQKFKGSQSALNVKKMGKNSEMLRLYRWHILASSFYFFTFQLTNNLFGKQQNAYTLYPFRWFLCGSIAGLNYSLITYFSHFSVLLHGERSRLMGRDALMNSMRYNKIYLIYGTVINGLGLATYKTVGCYLYFWDNWLYNV